jgi:ABC-type uncharacterized transport system involved in gliding motility auxiliary subunit
MIDDYVDKGGNLLWLHDPGELHGLEPLAERLGVEFHPGVIVDATTQAFGITDPRFALVGEYGNHPITQGFNLLTLFPQASGIDSQPAEGWQADSLLLSSSQSWSETGDLQGSITLDQGSDVPGPLNISVVMTREKPGAIAAETDLDKPAPETPKSQQRVVVIGDGDFLSNAYLGNSGNMDLGLRIINWLSRDDNLISIPAKTARDRTLELGSGQVAVIGFGFLLALPLLLLATGIVIWMRRRKR